MSKLRYEIETTVVGSEIHQRVLTEFEGRKQKLISQIVDTQNEQTIAALVKLGWTPPKEK